MKQEFSNMLDNLPKLAWACRRGMLELDVLLGNFLKEAYPTLSTEDQLKFVILLHANDPDLFSWLMGHAKPENQDMQWIVAKVRKHALKQS